MGKEYYFEDLLTHQYPFMPNRIYYDLNNGKTKIRRKRVQCLKHRRGQFPLRQRQSVRVLPRRPQDERPGYPIKERRLLMGSSLIIQGAASEGLGRPRSRETGPPGIILGEEDLMAPLA
ncbi:hypothetical protein CEXT_705571 [Caerostris extrusa]|uniref:Uncharacterized protein n=1 Tax=Caerostris extrusa TaxID=172846 RepID=A0AAV4Q3Q1_CAEEX|nr:hypothetical protein CEXT_705571 [Caerostris extrusa]